MLNFLKTRKFYILLIAIIGLLTSLELIYIYYQANFNNYALASFCTINDFIDCDGVAKTAYAQFAGIPLACWGVFFYSIIIFFVFVDKLKNIKFLGFLEVFKNPRTYIATLGYVAFIISMTLAFISLKIINKLCILCVFTYILDLLIALVATDFSNGVDSIIDVFKNSITDFIDAVKVPKYAVSFVICLLIFAGFLTYTNTTYVFTPQLKAQREHLYFEKLVQKNPYKVNGNILGDENAKITILLFTDYECPICKIFNVMLHKAMKDVKGIRIEHRNFPLDNKCNKSLEQPFHENACLYARYAIAAEKQGALGLMNDELFKNQPKTEDEIIEMVEMTSIDTIKLSKDAKSEETNKKLQESINEAIKYKVQGTPMFVLNGKAIPAMQPYEKLKKMLNDISEGKEVETIDEIGK